MYCHRFKQSEAEICCWTDKISFSLSAICYLCIFALPSHSIKPGHAIEIEATSNENLQM